MVSTWRFYSFKDIDFRSRQPFQLVILLGLLFAAIWVFSQWVLFVIALTYMFSGVFWRLQWIFRRKRNPAASTIQRGLADFMSSNFKSAAGCRTPNRCAGAIFTASPSSARARSRARKSRTCSTTAISPRIDVKLLDDEEALGQLESVGDEVTFIQNVRTEQFQNMDFTFFASDPESTRQNWKTARKAGSAIVDLSLALEDEPGATVRSPWIERQLGQTFDSGVAARTGGGGSSAAVVLALLLLRAQKAGLVKRAVATVFEPASEHGQKGMDELHEQTVNLLSFQPLPKNIFDAQVAFNMVARYGEHSAPRWRRWRAGC